jgi:hypothetical protein
MVAGKGLVVPKPVLEDVKGDARREGFAGALHQVDQVAAFKAARPHEEAMIQWLGEQWVLGHSKSVVPELDLAQWGETLLPWFRTV